MMILVNFLNLTPVFYKLVFMSVTAVMIGFVILIVRKIFYKTLSPFWNYAMWFLVLLALILPVRIKSEFAVIPKNSGLDRMSYREKRDVKDTLPYRKVERNSESGELSKSKEIGFNKSKGADLTANSALLDKILTVIWICGMSASFFYLLGGKLKLESRLKKYGRKTEQYEGLIEKAKEKLNIRADTEVMIMNEINSPALVGVIKPRIIVPIYIDQLKEESLFYVFMHELAHFKRKDMWLTYLMLFLQVIYWFNPLIWFLFKRFREDMEVVNDDYVLSHIEKEEHKNYAVSLVEVLGHMHGISPVPNFLCMADGKKNVERRIKMIQLFERLKKYKAFIAGLALIMIAVIAFFSFTEKGETRDTMKWLKELKTEDILQAELTVENWGSEEGKEYHLFSKEEYDELLKILNTAKGSYEKNPEELDGGSLKLYITTKDKELHTVENFGNRYVIIDNDYFKSDYKWLSKWDVLREKASLPIPSDFHYGERMTAFKGMELYIWKNKEKEVQYALFPGTNRLKTEREIYESKKATKELDNIKAELARMEDELYLFITQMKEEDFTSEEMKEIADKLKEAIPEGSQISAETFEAYHNGLPEDEPVETIDSLEDFHKEDIKVEKFNKDSGDVYQYSFTLNETFQSKEDLDIRIKNNFYSSLAYVLGTEEIVNQEGMNFLISEIRARIEKQGELKGLNDVGISLKDLKKVSLEVKIERLKQTNLSGGGDNFKTEFNIGYGADRENNEDKKAAMDLFGIRVPFSAFPKEANITEGEYKVEVLFRYFE